MNKPSLDDLLQDLQLAKVRALENNQINSVISAIALQAKLLGLDKGQVQENEPMPVQVIVDVVDCRKQQD